MKPVRTASHDANHYIPRDFLRDICGGFEVTKIGLTIAYTANFRGNRIVLIDFSAVGGVVGDWHIECVETMRYSWVEVKTPEAYAMKDHNLKPGEMWLRDNSGSWKMIVFNYDMEELMNWLTDE